VEIVVLANPVDCGRVVAHAVSAAVRAAPGEVTLGLATGSSPLVASRERVARHEAGPPFGAVTVVLLDEYLGLPDGHQQSYREVIRRELTDALGINPPGCTVPTVPPRTPRGPPVTTRRRLLTRVGGRCWCSHRGGRWWW
jgi:6-phosphogluconolactonase/glucosamine-6-phosphate isomerase/deaminase